VTVMDRVELRSYCKLKCIIRHWHEHYVVYIKKEVREFHIISYVIN